VKQISTKTVDKAVCNSLEQPGAEGTGSLHHQIAQSLSDEMTVKSGCYVLFLGSRKFLVTSENQRRTRLNRIRAVHWHFLVSLSLLKNFSS
jgi:hypothetical protein